jgi:hypothetical protein
MMVRERAYSTGRLIPETRLFGRFASESRAPSTAKPRLFSRRIAPLRPHNRAYSTGAKRWKRLCRRPKRRFRVFFNRTV